MAENQEVVEINPGMEKLEEKLMKEEEEEQEKKIPVFTVLKNNAILKNIFLIDSPPPGPSSSSSLSLNLVEKEKSIVADKQEFEEILVVGRHPDCNITLEHPSISRFHLRIHSIPSKQSISVIDLSSVHGTWLCGKKIAPGVLVELQNGDILQFGGSSRIYRLHWIPLSHAYDYDNPFVPPVEGSETLEEKEETLQDAEGPSPQHREQIQMGTDDFWFTDKFIMSKTKQLTPSAPPMPEGMKSPFSYEEETENKLPLDCSKSTNLQPAWKQDEERLSLQHDQRLTENEYLDGLDLLFSDMFGVSENTSFTKPASIMHEGIKSPLSCEEKAETKSSSYLSEVAGPKPIQQFHGENNMPNAAIASGEPQHESPESSTLRPQLNSSTSIWKRRGKYASVSISIQNIRAAESSNKTCVDFEVKSENHENLSIGLVTEDHIAIEDIVKEVFTPDKENCTPDFLLNRPFKKLEREKRKHEFSGHSIMSCMSEDTEGLFTPDKENITPNTHLLRSLKKLEKLEDIRCPETYRSSPLKNASLGVHQEMDKLISSNTENHVKKLIQEKKPRRSASRGCTRSDAEVTVLKGKAERVPFQPLLESPNNTTPDTSKLKAAIRNCNHVSDQEIKESTHPFHNPQKIPEENKKWTMVVDAACLLNKESRKALQLMQGLQGTSLIIPRIVIRELDCMKRRGNLFRRKTEVCSALEWTEDCMVNARSWIHVQSSMEDLRPIAATPPASPLSLFSQEVEKAQKFSISSVPFSPCGSWLDIVSPTTEDHILDCALFFQKIKNNGRLVLLSNDVTLKIKAMAEGLLCETAEEFRQSLVNPFSERFLWTDSSPRGTTWSCVDDVVLRENYYNNPIQKQSKSGEGAKGLKLILLHNSHFRQISSVR